MALRFDSVPPLRLFVHMSPGRLPLQEAYEESVCSTL